MKRLVLKPEGWPCSLQECPPGYFAAEDGEGMGFKNEYTKDGKPEAFNEAGEYWCSTGDVQPLVAEWEEYEPF
jgi:hypothetical protein